MSQPVGRTVGLYQIVQEIGSGNTGTVYKAYRPTLQRHVAVKVLHPQLARDSELAWRFQRGALIAAALKHPHIIAVYHVAREGDYVYVAADLIEGPSLAQRLSSEGPLRPEAALAILGQIASALDYAHDQGAVHRNLKPTNILFVPEGYAVLTDFGAEEDEPLPGRLDPLATVEYMSPEQIRHESLDRRSDVYSLGVVLFEMLTGRVPFSTPTAQGVAAKVLREGAPRVSRYNPKVPRPVDKVVARALNKRRERRYRSAGEMVRALARAIGAPVQAPLAIEDRPSPWSWVVRGVLVGLALAAVAGYVLLRVFEGVPLASSPTPTRTAPPTGTAPAPTATPARTRVRTAVPSPTRPEPTATPTPAPSPTATPGPPTPVPVARLEPTATPTVIPTPTLAPAPILLSPTDRSGIEGTGVTFRWHWGRALQPGEHYDLHVWRELATPLSIAWVDELTFRATSLDPNTYRWQVVVVREVGTNPDGSRIGEPVSQESVVWSFSFSPRPESTAGP